MSVPAACGHDCFATGMREMLAVMLSRGMKCGAEHAACQSGRQYLKRLLRRGQGRPLRPAIAGSVILLATTGVAAAGMAAMLLARPLLSGNAGDAAAAQSRLVHRHLPKTVVSLTFDDAYENQGRYAVPLLRSHHMRATFYVITADSDGPYPCCMSWAQLRTLQGEGDDIGSHTVSHPNLKVLTPARITREVCGSRQDMLRNGIDDPVSFAYPYGSYDTAAERIVPGADSPTPGKAAASPRTTPHRDHHGRRPCHPRTPRRYAPSR